MEELKDFLRQWNDDGDHIIAHTSGSTGTPKEIRLLKNDMRASARATNAFFGIDARSTLATPLSMNYIAGKMMAVRAIESGARMIALPVRNDFTLPEGVGIDLLAVVPSQLETLAARPEYAKTVRNVLVGGASPSVEMCNRLTAVGYKVYISYGMTETCSHVALARGDDAERIYHAMSGVNFRQTDDDRLIIDCPRLSCRELVTNDVVEMLSPDSFRWRGRADGVINSGGIKLFPEELEALYAPALAERSYYACAMDDDKWGQAAVLVVQGDDSEATTIMHTLRDAISDHRRLPKKCIMVAEIPKAGNGKIRRVLPTTRRPEE